jgi:hypothetical protein
MSTRRLLAITRIAPVVIGALAALLVSTDLAGAQPPPTNGTRWATYEVCYRVDASATGFGLDIDKAATDWTAASTNGFKFVKDETGACPNAFYEGFIDGLKGWYGYTIIETNNGLAGCDPNSGCVDPTPGSTILSAYSVLESRQCSESQQGCICQTNPAGHADFHDPLGCHPVLLPPGFCGPGGIPNTVMTPLGLRWDTPGVYETALHEFGHWLWMGDTSIFNPLDRDSALDWLAPQRCTDPGLHPDFYTLFGVDIVELNQLYP